MKPAFQIAAQILPTAVLAVSVLHMRQHLAHAFNALIVQITKKAALETDARRYAVDQQHNGTGGHDGDKQLGGNAEFHK